MAYACYRTSVRQWTVCVCVCVCVCKDGCIMCMLARAHTHTHTRRLIVLLSVQEHANLFSGTWAHGFVPSPIGKKFWTFTPLLLYLQMCEAADVQANAAHPNAYISYIHANIHTYICQCCVSVCVCVCVCVCNWQGNDCAGAPCW